MCIIHSAEAEVHQVHTITRSLASENEPDLAISMTLLKNLLLVICYLRVRVVGEFVVCISRLGPTTV